VTARLFLSKGGTTDTTFLHLLKTTPHSFFANFSQNGTVFPTNAYPSHQLQLLYSFTLCLPSPLPWLWQTEQYTLFNELRAKKHTQKNLKSKDFEKEKKILEAFSINTS
jgi:hypothetical protein